MILKSLLFETQNLEYRLSLQGVGPRGSHYRDHYATILTDEYTLLDECLLFLFKHHTSRKIKSAKVEFYDFDRNNWQVTRENEKYQIKRNNHRTDLQPINLLNTLVQQQIDKGHRVAMDIYNSLTTNKNLLSCELLSTDTNITNTDSNFQLLITDSQDLYQPMIRKGGGWGELISNKIK